MRSTISLIVKPGEFTVSVDRSVVSDIWQEAAQNARQILQQLTWQTLFEQRWKQEQFNGVYYIQINN